MREKTARSTSIAGVMGITSVTSVTSTSTSTSTSVVGEDRNVDEIVATLTGGRSVLVVGTLGSGKSFLIEAAIQALVAAGRLPLTVRAAAPLSATPFGALRANPRVAQLLDAASRPSTGEPTPVIVVDDGHLLDADSARWISQAVHVARITALVVSAPSSSAEARRAQPDTLTELDELWISGHAARVDLGPLTFAEAEELIEAEAGHAVVDRIRRADLYRASGGSRLFLIEMVRSLAEDASAPSSGIRITNRIRDVLRYQLNTLGRSQRVCLSLVSRLGGVTRPRLSRVVEARAIDRLLEKGYLVTDARNPDMLRAPSIFSTLRDNADETEETDEVDDLVDALGEILAAETALSADEATDIAMRWSFDGRLPKAVVAHGAGTVRRIVLAASTEAIEQGRFRDALLFAQMAESTGPSADARLALSRALSGLRRDDEALETLEAAVPLLQEDEEALRLFQWWSALLIGLARYEELPALSATAEGWPAVGPLLRGEILAARVQAAYAFMEWDDVARWGWEIFEDPDYALMTRVRAGVETASALAYRGDVTAAFRCLELIRRLNSDPVSGRALDEVAQVTILTGEALLRFTLGMCVRDILSEVEEILTRTGPRPSSTMLAFLAYTGAVADLFRGDLQAADLEYRAAVGRFTTADSSGWRAGIHSEHALVLGMLGDTVSAGSSLRQAEDLGAARSPVTRHLLTRARYVATSQSITEDLASIERELLALSEGSPALHAVNLYLILTNGGGTAEDRGTLQRLAAETDYALGALLEQHIVAVEGGDGREVERVAAAFAATGAYLLALRAQEDAIAAHGRDGNALRMSQARRQLAAYGVLSRRSDAAEVETTATRLSEREHQVACLIAEGLSNRQIADRLFLSVRTVESHIYQARLKLGVPTRRGLAELVDATA
ncbi:helix-turn-helix transcriptional regulator [Labedella endophytica]|nr:LuxR family transcriptional regulator [Labedella endophytica]